MATFEYAPAPESRAVVDIASSYGLFIGGEFVEARAARRSRRSTRPPRRSSPRSPRPARPTSTAPCAAARTAYTGVWSRMSGADRGKYLFRIARILQERAREFAVLESLDNGKPIKESRDVDVPARRGALLLPRRLGRQARLRLASAPTRARSASSARSSRGTSRCSCWRGRSRRPWPPATPSSSSRPRPPRSPRCSSPRSCQQADLPPGRRQHRHRRRRHRPGHRRPPRHRQARLHRLDRVGKMIARSIAGTRKKATLELGGKAANIVFDDAPIDQAVEGIVNGIFFNQGHVCCAGLAAARAGEHRRASVDDAPQAPPRRRCASATRSTRTPTSGAINSRKQLERIVELTAVGEAEGAERWDNGCELPSKGFWFRPTVFTGVSQTHRIAQEEIFGPVALGADLPHARTRRSPRPTTPPTACPPASGPRRAARILWMADQLRAGVVWANTFNKFDPTSAVRWLQGVRLRPRGRPPRPRGLRDDRGSSPVSTRVDVRKTYKLYIGGQFPRSESGRSYEVYAAPPASRRGATTRPPQFLANAAQGSRKDARDAVVAARKAQPRLGRRDGIQPRPGALPRRRGDGVAPAPARRRTSATARASPRAQADTARLGGRRPLGLVRRLVRQVHAGARRAQPRRRARTSTSRRPSRPVSWPSSRRRRRACSGSCRCSRRSSSRATPPSSSRARSGRCRPSPSPSASPPPTSRAAWSTSSPAAPPRSRRGSPRTATSTPSTSPARPAPRASCWGDLELAAADNLKRVLRPGGRGRRGGRARLDGHPRPVPAHGVPRDQDRLAPQGPVTDPARAGRRPRRAERRRQVAPRRPAPRRPRLAVVRLDDFYRDEDDPAMPRSEELGIVDWDHPDSWNRGAAARRPRDPRRAPAGRDAGLRHRRRAVPSGPEVVSAGPADLVLAEGIFAAEVIGDLRERGLLAAAYCVHHHRAGDVRPAAAARPVRAAQAAVDPRAPRAGAHARRAPRRRPPGVARRRAVAPGQTSSPGSLGSRG